MKTKEDETLDIMNKWVKGDLTTMEADNELTKSMVHKTAMIYQDPITEQIPEGEACLLHRIASLGDGLEIWKVCFSGDDGGVYERTLKIKGFNNG